VCVCFGKITLSLKDCMTQSKRAEVHDVSVNDIALVDRFTAVTACSDTTLKTFDCETLETKTTLSGHEEVVNAVCNTSNGLIASGSEDKTIRLFDPRSGVSCRSVVKGHKEGVVSLKSVGENTVAAGDRSGIVGIYDERQSRKTIFSFIFLTPTFTRF